MRKDNTDKHTCAVTGQILPDAALIRFVLGPGNQVFPDIGGKLPGNEVWITCDSVAVQSALDQGLFAELLDPRCEPHPDLISSIENMMRDSALGMLSMSKKAGIVVAGFVKVDEAIRKSKVAILLHATQAASDGKEKLNRLANRCLGKDFIGHSAYCLLTGSELDQALGGSNIRHAAILEGGPANELRTRLERLRAFTRTGWPV